MQLLHEYPTIATHCVYIYFAEAAPMFVYPFIAEKTFKVHDANLFFFTVYVNFLYTANYFVQSLYI